MVKDIAQAKWWELLLLVFVDKTEEITRGLDNSYYRCVTKKLGDTTFILELGY